MDKNILKIAIPAIISNIIVPLLGLIDLTIAGHLGATEFIGAIAVGATMFNLTYWNFGFLRMGTTGLTAQAFGSRDRRQMAENLYRSTALAILLGIGIIILQRPVEWLLLEAIGPTEETRRLASEYFRICIWNAPAVLANMSISGWFVGMQNSIWPMTTAIAINIINIAVSLACVYLAGMGFAGIAVGTLAAQWAGLAMSMAIAWKFRKTSQLPTISDCSKRLLRGISGYFKLNGDIFLRSVCIMIVTLFFTSAGARTGDLTLAVNAIIMQLYMFYSYFMDGFAFAAEALTGRFAGAADETNLKKYVLRLFVWGAIVTTAFATIYGLGGNAIFTMLTDQTAVRAAASDYIIWAAVIPIAGMAAFIWDGVFVGLTATRQMLASLAVATAVFFTLFFCLTVIPDANDRLWTAFISYLFIRGFILTVAFRQRKPVKNQN